MFAYTRYAQIQIRKNKSSEKEGSRQRVPLLTKMKGWLLAGEKKISPMECQWVVLYLGVDDQYKLDFMSFSDFSLAFFF